MFGFEDLCGGAHRSAQRCTASAAGEASQLRSRGLAAHTRCLSESIHTIHDRARCWLHGAGLCRFVRGRPRTGMKSVAKPSTSVSPKRLQHEQESSCMETVDFLHDLRSHRLF